MDENYQDKTESKRTTTEDKLWLPPLSPQDQKKLTHLQKNRKNPVRAIIKWTGFSGKTLWDWLQLLGVLAIPLVVVGATIAFGIQQANLANQQHEADQQQALDQQRQATLVGYLDDMKDLLLNRGLLTSKPSDEIRAVARTETLSAMRQLDGKRNRFLVQFLRDAQLIGIDDSGIEHNIIDFFQADLSGIDLRGVDLDNISLHVANLSGANLSGADLSGADLSDANLSNAYLRGAELISAYLSGATLRGADLSGADLNTVDLRGAYLSDAHMTQQQLDQVSTCKDAILPGGLVCHQNY